MLHYPILEERMSRLLRSTNREKYCGGANYANAKQLGNYKAEFYEIDSSTLHFILWADERKRCVDVILHSPENIASLSLLEYNPSCSVDGKMKHGKDTRDMLFFTLRFLKKKGIREVSLMDNSRIECNGTKIHLAPMYFLKYGQTWYEKYFGFKPTEKYKDKYEEMKRRRETMLSVSHLSQMPCDFFTEDVVDNLFEHIGFVFLEKIEWTKKL